MTDTQTIPEMNQGRGLAKVVITDEPGVLPPEIRPMVDPGTPLAPGVRFFEEKFTLAGTARTLGMGLGLGIAGLLMVVFGVKLLIYALSTYARIDAYDSWPLVAGLVFLFASGLMIHSLKGRWSVMRAQQAGTRTRYGIFLVDDILVSRRWFDITVIPLAMFQGLKNRSVAYEFGGKPKSFDLPSDIVGADTSGMLEAIRQWAAQGPVVSGGDGANA